MLDEADAEAALKLAKEIDDELLAESMQTTETKRFCALKKLEAADASHAGKLIAAEVRQVVMG